MKRQFYTLIIFFIACFLVGIEKAQGQQDPQYSHYMFNELNYNPAFAGNHDRRICATFLQHSQWTGFEGFQGGTAPSTQVFNAHVPLVTPYIHGAGLAIFNDQQGFENTVSIAAYGSHKFQTPVGRLSIGLGGGIIQKKLNTEKLRAIQEPDPVIPDDEVSKIIPDVNLGVYLDAENYYVGLSALHLIEGDMGWTEQGGGESKYERHYYLTGGYIYNLNENWDIKPSLLLKFDGTKIQTDINGRAVLNEKYWGGLGYRIGDKALTGMLGMYLTPKLKIGYSFDLPFNPNDVKTGGTHEFLIGYCWKFNPKPKEEFPIWSPRFLNYEKKDD